MLVFGWDFLEIFGGVLISMVEEGSVVFVPELSVDWCGCCAQQKVETESSSLLKVGKLTGIKVGATFST
jgi:hypothetical protein